MLNLKRVQELSAARSEAEMACDRERLLSAEHTQVCHHLPTRLHRPFTRQLCRSNGGAKTDHEFLLFSPCRCCAQVQA